MFKVIDQFKKHYFITLMLAFVGISGVSQGKIAGISMVAPPREFKEDPIPPIKDVNANWVALIPYGYSIVGRPEVYFDSERNWWGERSEGIEESIKLAKSHGLKIMLKPQVWIPRGWVGNMDFESEEAWKIWESSYREYLMNYVQMAIKYEVEMLCIGTEYRISVVKREAYWRNLINDIKAVYDGLLVYSANWDSYENVPFWDAVDYIGISSYFPLSELKTPPVFLLNYKWKSIIKRLRKFSESLDKPVLFSEFGYLSVDGSAGKTWELEEELKEARINEKAQANALHALLSAFSSESFWAGGFLWKWFPNGEGHEGFPEKDYTPQGKLSEDTISYWFKKFTE